MISASHPEAQKSGKSITVRSLPPVVIKACAWRYLCPNAAEFAVKSNKAGEASVDVCGGCLAEVARKFSQVPAVVF